MLLPPANAQYLLEDAIRGWLFHVNASGRTLAYLITRLDYTPPGEEEAGRILLELKANSKGKITLENLIIHSKDLVGKTITEIFIGKSYLKETPDLIANYDEAATRPIRQNDCQRCGRSVISTSGPSSYVNVGSMNWMSVFRRHPKRWIG